MQACSSQLLRLGAARGAFGEERGGERSGRGAAARCEVDSASFAAREARDGTGNAGDAAEGGAATPHPVSGGVATLHPALTAQARDSSVNGVVGGVHGVRGVAASPIPRGVLGGVQGRAEDGGRGVGRERGGERNGLVNHLPLMARHASRSRFAWIVLDPVHSDRSYVGMEEEEAIRLTSQSVYTQGVVEGGSGRGLGGARGLLDDVSEREQEGFERARGQQHWVSSGDTEEEDWRTVSDLLGRRYGVMHGCQDACPRVAAARDQLAARDHPVRVGNRSAGDARAGERRRVWEPGWGAGGGGADGGDCRGNGGGEKNEEGDRKGGGGGGVGGGDETFHVPVEMLCPVSRYSVRCLCMPCEGIWCDNGFVRQQAMTPVSCDNSQLLPLSQACQIASLFLDQSCFLCRELMRNPMICPDGHTYEANAISQWLLRKVLPRSRPLIREKERKQRAREREREVY
jgi:hypothetical protein